MQNVYAYPDTACVEWFKKEKIDIKSKNCESDCSVAMVDMATFHCTSQCSDLCMMTDGNGLSKYVFYPGLKSKEKILIDKYPKEALIVFVQKARAELSSSRNFPTQKLNDEGDGFRHYMWAGLLTKELGPEMAKMFLDAHEENPLQTKEEKSMDLAKNRGAVFSQVGRKLQI